MPIPVIVPIIAVGCAFTAPVLGMAAAGADRRRSFLHLHSSRPQPSTHAHTPPLRPWCAAARIPHSGETHAGGNPGRPEVQNPNGLSQWIDRTFGFNPEQVYLYI
jgi:hypothetical protein